MKSAAKFVITFIVIIIIVFSVSFISTKVLNEGSIKIIGYLDEIEEKIILGDFSSPLTDHYEDEWEKQKKLWTVFISETEINLVYASNSRLKAYISQESKIHSISEIQLLKTIFQQIASSNTLTWDNLL